MKNTLTVAVLALADVVANVRMLRKKVGKFFAKVKRLNLNLDDLEVIHIDNNRQRSYFEGYYIVEVNGEIVGEGKLVYFHNGDIVYELQRLFDFYCHTYLSN